MEETLQIPTSHRTAEPRSAQAGPHFVRRLMRDSAYALSALPIGILTFTIVVTGFSAGVGLFVIWVGLPVLVGMLLLARVFANLERLRLRSLQDRAAPGPSYLRAGADDSLLRRLLTPLRDPQSWFDAVWGIVGFVTGMVAFVFTITWWAAAAGGLTYWFWERWLPNEDTSLAELIGLGEGRTPQIWLNLALGVVALVTLPLVVRAVAAFHSGTSSAILDGRARLGADRA